MKANISPDNCIRQEKGYCRIKWHQNAATSPDPFQLDTQTPAVSTAAAGGIPLAAGTALPCLLAYVSIPDGSPNGVAPLDLVASGLAFQNTWCGSHLAYTGTAVASSIVCKSPGLREYFQRLWKVSTTVQKDSTSVRRNFPRQCRKTAPVIVEKNTIVEKK